MGFVIVVIFVIFVVFVVPSVAAAPLGPHDVTALMKLRT